MGYELNESFRHMIEDAVQGEGRDLFSRPTLSFETPEADRLGGGA